MCMAEKHKPASPKLRRAYCYEGCDLEGYGIWASHKQSHFKQVEKEGDDPGSLTSSALHTAHTVLFPPKERRQGNRVTWIIGLSWGHTKTCIAKEWLILVNTKHSVGEIVECANIQSPPCSPDACSIHRPASP